MVDLDYGENPDEASQAVFGKEKLGRVCRYGRDVTKTSLKMNDEISALVIPESRIA